MVLHNWTWQIISLLYVPIWKFIHTIIHSGWSLAWIFMKERVKPNLNGTLYLINWLFERCLYEVKVWRAKIVKTKILKTNGSLMKVEGIAECLGAFCNTFQLHLAIIGLENQFSVLLQVAVLQRFYCTTKCTVLVTEKKNINKTKPIQVRL